MARVETAQLEAMQPTQPIERIPFLGRVPLPSERSLPPKNLIETGMHEWQHAIAAGFSNIESLSVVPEGRSLGRVKFSGFMMTPDDIKRTAAAGAIDTPIGKASGFGSDLLTIALISASQGLNPQAEIQRSILSAKLRIGSYPKELLLQIGEILPFLGEINKSEFRLVEERARWELAWKKGGKSALPNPAFESDLSLQENGKTTQITYLDGEYKIVSTDGDNTRHEFTLCGHCGGIDQQHDRSIIHPVKDNLSCPVCQGRDGFHSPNCEIRKGRQPIWQTTIYIDSNGPIESVPLKDKFGFPQSAVVFWGDKSEQ